MSIIFIQIDKALNYCSRIVDGLSIYLYFLNIQKYLKTSQHICNVKSHGSQINPSVPELCFPLNFEI